MVSWGGLLAGPSQLSQAAVDLVAICPELISLADGLPPLDVQFEQLPEGVLFPPGFQGVFNEVRVSPYEFYRQHCGVMRESAPSAGTGFNKALPPPFDKRRLNVSSRSARGERVDPREAKGSATPTGKS